MKMRYLFIVLLASFVVADDFSCDCFDGVCHTRTPIASGYHVMGQMAMDKQSNIFYFHMHDTARNYYNVAFDVDSVKASLIPLDFTFARAVEPNTRDVYISEILDLYKTNPTQYDVLTKLRKFENINVWQTHFYGNKLFYTDFTTIGIKYFQNRKHGKLTRLDDFVIQDFIVDKRGDIYFTSNETLYRYSEAEDMLKPEVIDHDFYFLTTDAMNNAHFIQPATRGVYKIDYSSFKLIEVGAFGAGMPDKIVFDKNNNMIFHDAQTSDVYISRPEYSRRCAVGNNDSTGPQKKVQKKQATENHE